MTAFSEFPFTRDGSVRIRRHAPASITTIPENFLNFPPNKTSHIKYTFTILKRICARLFRMFLQYREQLCFPSRKMCIREIFYIGVTANVYAVRSKTIFTAPSGISM